MDVRLRMGSTMLVCGPHTSGKTVFIMKLIDAAKQMFDIPPTAVYWIYGQRTAMHEQMVRRNYNMIEGLPKKFDFIQPNSIVMLDDLMVAGAKDANVTNLFIASAHHVPCFVIFTMQNIFAQGKEMRTIALNTNYNVLFKNKRDPNQIAHLGRQVFPDSPQLLRQVFEEATQEPYAYLFLDFRNESPEIIKMRARILPEEKPMICFVNKQLHAGITTSKYLKLDDKRHTKRLGHRTVQSW